MSSKPALAILDDYLSISQKHFAHIPSEYIRVDVFDDAISAQSVPGDRSSPVNPELIKRLQPYTAILAMRERTALPGDLLRALPNLKVIFTTGAQFRSFDLVTAKELGIRMATATGKGRTDGKGIQVHRKIDPKKGGVHPTTQHTWALILALANRVVQDDNAVKAGNWQGGLMTALAGKTIGIVGLGKLGGAVARIAVVAWGMKVICWSSSLTQEKADETARSFGLDPDQDGAKTFRVVEKPELFRTADVVSIHYVLSDRSRGIVGKEELDFMKPTAFLVNTSRGPLVNEGALLDVLERGKIQGAAFDVFPVEPLPADSPWRSQKWGTEGRSTLLTTPHMGYVEEQTLNAWYAETAENVERWLDGQELLNPVL
ncbi:hypothetical protein P152DRAFT_393559 [Eremomyces bilateralis CBS 781.70]|uniref:Glycerate dehydrogenase n=1 Tax=Eremomyces bilateralis CBS 781.70 TaxID=1392243 RepID=A0A6G1G9S5_9PEZI|nr:uncharacterized protein P152DRAFT_393559 [Eremomyces bilateralis CBS 781.70]KAF1814660.1 hypothetical protein P152DRAFT_393559 [Eremomyces bilateralis CBS 781.70]